MTLKHTQTKWLHFKQKNTQDIHSRSGNIRMSVNWFNDCIGSKATGSIPSMSAKLAACSPTMPGALAMTNSWFEWRLLGSKNQIEAQRKDAPHTVKASRNKQLGTTKAKVFNTCTLKSPKLRWLILELIILDFQQEKTQESEKRRNK